MTAPTRRRLAASTVLALLAPAVLAACSSGDGEGDAVPTVSATVTPALVQSGPEPADSKDAEALVEVRLEPADSRGVVLERRTGGAWEPVEEDTTEGDGTAQVQVENDPKAELRVVAGAAVSESFSVPEAQWSDEFDGRTLDDRWGHRQQEYNPGGQRACSKGDESAVTVEGGTASLAVLVDPDRTGLCQARAQDGKALGGFPYRLNANIQTQKAYRYGTFAARIKFQRGRGQHGAFWLQTTGVPGTSSVAEDGAEIDVVEYFGDTDEQRLASFVYYVDERGEAVKNGDFIEDSPSYLAGPDDDWWKSYHVFSVDWTEDEYVVRIDGVEAWRTDEGVSRTPEYVILSMLSSDYEIPLLAKGGYELPQAMQVDWVSYWPGA